MKTKYLSNNQNVITLSSICRILSNFACIILTIENLILFILSDLANLLFGSPGYVEAYKFIMTTPIDVVAFILFGIALIFEYYQGRCPSFLCIGLLFLCWGFLTVIWRIMIYPPQSDSADWREPSWVILKPFVIPIIIFLIAAVCLTLALGLLIVTLDRLTKEGLAIQELHPRSRSLFHFISYLYLGSHLIFSIITFLAFIPSICSILSIPKIFFDSVVGRLLQILGFFAFFLKLMMVPIFGAFFYLLITVLYMNHRFANVQKVN